MFLSVIIPVYNGERYLGECLDSIFKQDLPRQEWEVLCVNDGSTDASARILEDYEKQYENLRVITQANGGVTVARNAGLDVARGDFIWFVDADDRIAPNCLSQLKSLAGEGTDRIVVGGYTFTDVLTREELDRAEKGTLPKNVSWQDAVVWRNLLRREFLGRHGLRFRYPELTHGEDGLFMYEVSISLPRTVELEKTLYFYRVHSGSAETHTAPENRMKKVRSYLRILEILQKYYAQRRDPATANKLTAMLWLALYETAQLPGGEARKVVNELRALELYPSHLLPECTITRSYLAENAVLEFFCCHLHRPWGYGAIRALRKLQGALRRLRGA